MVVVTMRVRAKSTESFRDALTWLVEQGKPKGLHTMQVLRGLAHPDEMLLLCELDDQDSWQRWAERVGPEFDRRTDTTGQWTDDFWVQAENTPTFSSK